MLCIDPSESCPDPFLVQGTKPSSTGYWNRFSGPLCFYSGLSTRAQTGGWTGICTVAPHVAKRWGGGYNSTWCTESCSPGASWHPGCVTHADDVEWAALEAYSGVDDRTSTGRELDPMPHFPGSPESTVFCQCRCHPDILPRTERIPIAIGGNLAISFDSRSVDEFAEVLGHVRSIAGKLSIRGCSTITSLGFLGNVVEVAGGIEIWDNENIESLGGFNPERVAGGISIGSCPKLPAATTLTAANGTSAQMGKCCMLSHPLPHVGEYAANRGIVCDTNTTLVQSKMFQRSGKITNCQILCEQWADCAGFDFNSATGGCIGVNVCLRLVAVNAVEHYYYEKVTTGPYSGRDWDSDSPSCTKADYIPAFPTLTNDSDLANALGPGMVGCCPANTYPDGGGGCTECAAWDTTPAGQTAIVSGAFRPLQTGQCRSFSAEVQSHYVVLAWAVGADAARCIVSPGCDADWIQTDRGCIANSDWYSETCELELPCTDSESIATVLAIDSGDSAKVEKLDLTGALTLDRTRHSMLFHIEAVDGREEPPPSPYTDGAGNMFYARLRKNWVDRPDECLTLQLNNATTGGFSMEPCSVLNLYHSQVFLLDHSDGTARTTFHLLLETTTADSKYNALQPTKCKGFISGTSVISSAAQPLSEREQRWQVVVTEIELRNLNSSPTPSTVSSAAAGTTSKSTTVAATLPADAVVVILVYNIPADEVFSSSQSELEFKHSVMSSLVAVGIPADDILQIKLRRVSGTASARQRRASGDIVEADVTVRNEETKARVEKEGDNGNIQTHYNGQTYEGKPKKTGKKDDDAASSSLRLLAWLIPGILIVLILAAAVVGVATAKRRRTNMYGTAHDGLVYPIDRTILDDHGFHPMHYTVVLGDVVALRVLLMPNAQRHTNAMSLDTEQSRRTSGPFPRLSQLSITSKVSNTSVQLPRFSEDSIDTMHLGEIELESALGNSVSSQAVPGLSLLVEQLPSSAHPTVPQIDAAMHDVHGDGTSFKQRLGEGKETRGNAEVPNVPQTLLELTPDILPHAGSAPVAASPIDSQLSNTPGSHYSLESASTELTSQYLESQVSNFPGNTSTFRSQAFSSVQGNNPLTSDTGGENQYDTTTLLEISRRMSEHHHNANASVEQRQAVPNSLYDSSSYVAGPPRADIPLEQRHVMPNAVYSSSPHTNPVSILQAYDDTTCTIPGLPDSPRTSVVFDPRMADLALLDVRDSQGNTPTMWAVRAQKLHVLEFLIEHGADVSAPNLEQVCHALQCTHFGYIAQKCVMFPSLLLRAERPISVASMSCPLCS